MMLPFNNQPGSLESLVKISAYEKWNHLVPALDAYVDASEVPNWGIGRQDKMRLQCLIAATCEKNPYTTISTLFRLHEKYHIPLAHNCFDKIVEFLKNWDSMLPN